MARTKQTMRKSTGGRAPRKQLSTAAARGDPIRYYRRSSSEPDGLSEADSQYSGSVASSEQPKHTGIKHASDDVGGSRRQSSASAPPNAGPVATHSDKEPAQSQQNITLEQPQTLQEARDHRIYTCQQALFAPASQALVDVLLSLWTQYNEESERWQALPEYPVTWTRFLEDLRGVFRSEQGVRDFCSGQEALKIIQPASELFSAVSGVIGDFTIFRTVKGQIVEVSQTLDQICSFVEPSLGLMGFKEPPKWILYADSYEIARPLLAYMQQLRSRELDSGSSLPGVDWRGGVFINRGQTHSTLQRYFAWMALKIPKGTPVFGITTLDGAGLGRWRAMIDSAYAPTLYHARWLGGDVASFVHALEEKNQLQAVARGKAPGEGELLRTLASEKDAHLSEIADTATELEDLGFSLPATALGEEFLDRFVLALKRNAQASRRRVIEQDADKSQHEARRFNWNDRSFADASAYEEEERSRVRGEGTPEVEMREAEAREEGREGGGEGEQGAEPASKARELANLLAPSIGETSEQPGVKALPGDATEA